MKSAARRAEAKLNRDLDKWERDTNRALQSAARKSAPRPQVSYSTDQRRYMTGVAEVAQRETEQHPERCDVFLCHAWDDRQGAAKELHDLLEGFGVRVWFSEKHVPLGTSLIREIDRGLAESKMGVVLATPSMLKRLRGQGVADKELSALLATERVIPVVYGTTFEALRGVSPLLASRSGLSTEEDTLEQIATKLANAVCPEEENGWPRE